MFFLRIKHGPLASFGCMWGPGRYVHPCVRWPVHLHISISIKLTIVCVLDDPRNPINNVLVGTMCVYNFVRQSSTYSDYFWAWSGVLFDWDSQSVRRYQIFEQISKLFHSKVRSSLLPFVTILYISELLSWKLKACDLLLEHKKIRSQGKFRNQNFVSSKIKVTVIIKYPSFR